MSSALLDIENVYRTYTDISGSKVEALYDINLAVEKGEFVSIIGPSGCGKTTLLRLIAGLDRPESGSLTLDGEIIAGTDPHRGYVFQQGSLFPWLTVEKNIAAGLKARGVYAQEKQHVREYIELIGLNGFEKS
jgi:NitT/TauT family transport system ATP-binding protein/sulfonate transport system ATP-binding protein